jgi:hypothetical protein
VLAGVHRARRAGRAARRRPAETAARGGRLDGPRAGGGRVTGARRGRERAPHRRRDGAARRRTGQLAGASGPAVGRGRVRGRPGRGGRPPAARRGRVRVGPQRDGYRAAGALEPHGQGGGPARRGRRRVSVGVRRVAEHDHRGVRVAATRGRPAPPVPHDGGHTVVGPVSDVRPAQWRHAARLRRGRGRRARRQDDIVAGPAAPAVQTRVADGHRGSSGETDAAEKRNAAPADVRLTRPRTIFHDTR